ncbi:GNAT family N-acetyltransferase [Deinococcus sp. QL22]|uniref:GNAT family N-acetyltransferase n=1 Tax=Deinococcus sp. QL22 TaxID=2939437 RepID=UPI002016D3A0|nr:GNAT family protein [Deinococcus sp. QL22]UQN06147.1 GNAT family N-acetyltransferase [Deinococcus sp. QL22]
MTLPPAAPLPDPQAVSVRGRRPRDLPTLRRWLADPQAQWREWDAPYFHAASTSAVMQAYVDQLASRPPDPDERVVDVGGVCIGMVNRSEEAPAGGGWWDLGILVYDPAHWGRGVGTRALELWVTATFEETNAHVVTFTTWSGNERMIRAALRLGFREAGRVREARVVQGQRYDSVRLDMLCADWERANWERHEQQT